MPLEKSCTTEEAIIVTCSPKTTTGKPAEVEGAIRVSVVSGNGTIEQRPDKPLVFAAVSGDSPGDTSYLIEADADLGAGEELIQDTFVLKVSGAKAANLGMSAGDPVPKVQAVPQPEPK